MCLIIVGHQGKYDEAMSNYQRAVAISEKALGAEHPMVATGLNSLGVLLQSKGWVKKYVSHC